MTCMGVIWFISHRLSIFFFFHARAHDLSARLDLSYAIIIMLRHFEIPSTVQYR